MKCAIIDDEPLALDLLESYILKTPMLQLRLFIPSGEWGTSNSRLSICVKKKGECLQTKYSSFLGMPQMPIPKLGLWLAKLGDRNSQPGICFHYTPGRDFHMPDRAYEPPCSKNR